MAWVRTATSLIAFGFAIFQFFEWLRESQGIAAGAHSAAPRYLGMVLLATGIATVTLAAWQYRKLVHYMWSQQFSSLAGIGKAPMHSGTLVIAIVIIAIGLFALASVILGLP